LYDGYRVPVHYDPLIAKVIVHAEQRALAIKRAEAALHEYLIDGIKTNIPLHLKILADPDFAAGRFSTNFLKRFEARRESVTALPLAQAS
jgi:acetyl-CoA carboxylase biotin carboxylase subunit